MKLTSGRIARMPRFVLLYHDCPPTYERTSHWDFMLEVGDVLRTWSVEQLPRNWNVSWSRTFAACPHCPLLAPDNTVTAVKLNDHRLDYLELEGTLSGDRGNVIRVAAGTYLSEYNAPGNWRIVLASTDLSAHACLSRPEADGNQWTLSCS